MFRNGQWVCFDGRNNPQFDGAFRTRGGKVVGIYQSASQMGTIFEPASVVVVDGNGENLMIKMAGMLLPVKMGTELPGLEPCLRREDIPAARISHLPKTWQPEP